MLEIAIIGSRGAMHELSIAQRLVEVATDYATKAGARHVRTLTLRIGRLSSIHPNALEFGFQAASENTMLEGARLRIVEVPVTIYCPVCRCEVELPGIQQLQCPRCGTPGGDIRAGRELDLESIELDVDAPP